MAEAEHQEPIVVDAAVAEELATGDDGDEIAGERALEGDVLHPRDAIIERRFPGGAEAFGAGLAAQIIGALGRHVDHGRGAGDRAGVGQRLDEGALASRSPAVVAGAFARHGLEGGERGAGVGRGWSAVLH